MKTQDQILQEWSKQLLAAFELEGVEVDVNTVLSLAGVAAHSIVRPAAPLTTFIAGYAAGKAAGAGQSEPSMAVAMEMARKLAAEHPQSQDEPSVAAGAVSTTADAAPVVDSTE